MWLRNYSPAGARGLMEAEWFASDANTNCAAVMMQLRQQKNCASGKVEMHLTFSIRQIFSVHLVKLCMSCPNNSRPLFSKLSQKHGYTHKSYFLYWCYCHEKIDIKEVVHPKIKNTSFSSALWSKLSISIVLVWAVEFWRCQMLTCLPSLQYKRTNVTEKLSR